MSILDSLDSSPSVKMHKLRNRTCKHLEWQSLPPSLTHGSHGTSILSKKKRAFGGLSENSNSFLPRTSRPELAPLLPNGKFHVILILITCLNSIKCGFEGTFVPCQVDRKKPFTLAAEPSQKFNLNPWGYVQGNTDKMCLKLPRLHWKELRHDVFDVGRGRPRPMAIPAVLHVAEEVDDETFGRPLSPRTWQTCSPMCRKWNFCPKRGLSHLLGVSRESWFTKVKLDLNEQVVVPAGKTIDWPPVGWGRTMVWKLRGHVKHPGTTLKDISCLRIAIMKAGPGNELQEHGNFNPHASQHFPLKTNSGPDQRQIIVVAARPPAGWPHQSHTDLYRTFPAPVSTNPEKWFWRATTWQDFLNRLVDQDPAAANTHPYREPNQRGRVPWHGRPRIKTNHLYS